MNATTIHSSEIVAQLVLIEADPIRQRVKHSIAGFLAGCSGTTLEAYRLDLCGWIGWLDTARLDRHGTVRCGWAAARYGQRRGCVRCDSLGWTGHPVGAVLRHSAEGVVSCGLAEPARSGGRCSKSLCRRDRVERQWARRLIRSARAAPREDVRGGVRAAWYGWRVVQHAGVDWRPRDRMWIGYRDIGRLRDRGITRTRCW